MDSIMRYIRYKISLKLLMLGLSPFVIVPNSPQDENHSTIPGTSSSGVSCFAIEKHKIQTEVK